MGACGAEAAERQPDEQDRGQAGAEHEVLEDRRVPVDVARLHAEQVGQQEDGQRDRRVLHGHVAVRQSTAHDGVEEVEVDGCVADDQRAVERITGEEPDEPPRDEEAHEREDQRRGPQPARPVWVPGELRSAVIADCGTAPQARRVRGAADSTKRLDEAA